MFGSSSKTPPPPTRSTPGKPAPKAAKPTPTGRVDTLIGKQTTLTGDVRFAGGLHVDGTMKGKVIADSDKNAVLSVSESGKIEGDVRVPHVVLNGTVVGDVHATERLQLSEKARVTGNVYYKIIEMASGAAVNGQMVHQDAEYLEEVGKGKAAGSNSNANAGKNRKPESDLVVERNPVAKAS